MLLSRLYNSYDMLAKLLIDLNGSILLAYPRPIVSSLALRSRRCELCMETNLISEQTAKLVVSAMLQTIKVRWSLCRDMIMESASMGRPAGIQVSKKLLDVW